MADIVVSINCITYNHEKYISQAIDSFLMQKTNFKFEILIHDDASTDGTAEIIKGYQIKYPDLIKPLFQMENQYSQGVKIGNLNEKRAVGKYIALCEGDDYWVDPYKLQKQVDYMESDLECSVCVHAAYKVSKEGKKLLKHARPNRRNKIFEVDEVILGGGGMFATNTMVYRSRLVTEMPNFYTISIVGDYPLMIYLALQGTVYYIDEFMASYRVGAIGSWSERTLPNVNKVMIHLNQTIEMLTELDSHTHYRFSAAINKRKKTVRFNSLVKQRQFEYIRSGEFKEYYEQLTWARKLKMFVQQYFPGAVSLIKKFYMHVSI